MERRDTRKLELFQRRLGEYDIAGAIYSWGDVIGFVESYQKQGIMVIDTCGHFKDYGRDMADFLERKIQEGWGVERGSKEELELFGELLYQLRETDEFIDAWYDYVSASYTQLAVEGISLSMGGGIGPMFHFKEDEIVEMITQGAPIDRICDPQRDLSTLKEPYETQLGQNDVLFLTTDGLEGNMCYGYEDLADLQREDLWETIHKKVTDTISKEQGKSVTEIRDAIISQLGKYFLPRHVSADDVTFVVVKRM